MTSLDDLKRYNYMENVLLKINQKYISLDETAKKQNNVILSKILDEIITRMKRQDPLFVEMYQRIFYGGSYYDGLKINNPEEYDLDMVLDLPKLLGVKLVSGVKPGYVYMVADELENFKKSAEAEKYPKLDTLMCDGKYFSTKKVRSWIESLLSKALKDFDQNEIITHVSGQILKTEIVNFCKSGPAFTLKVKTEINGKEIVMDVDLVSCFLMTTDKWPKGYVSNPVSDKDTFFVVPKEPYSNDEGEKYWRLSFQEQERVIMKSKDFKALKPSAKLIKQLRNSQNHKPICSYFIKTIFLWELKKQNLALWTRAPLSFVFMTMLKKYAEYLSKGIIPYYWNPKYNLVEHVNKVTLADFGNKIKNISASIENSPLDPFIVAKCLLPATSVEELKQEVDIGKKHVKKQQTVAVLQTTPPSDSNKQMSVEFNPPNMEVILAILKDPEVLTILKKIYDERNHQFAVSTSKHPNSQEHHDKIECSETAIVTNLIDLHIADDSTSECTSHVDVTDAAFDGISQNTPDYLSHHNIDDSVADDSQSHSNSLDNVLAPQNDASIHECSHEIHECCAHLKSEIAIIKEDIQRLIKLNESILNLVTPESATKKTEDTGILQQTNFSTNNSMSENIGLISNSRTLSLDFTNMFSTIPNNPLIQQNGEEKKDSLDILTEVLKNTMFKEG